jgi:HlyD family secretion protein
MDRIIEKKNRFFRKKYIWLYVLGAVILLIILSIIFSDKSSKLNVEKDKITMEEITEDYFKDYIAVIGNVEPIKTVFLDATEGGSRVEKILIEEGNMVKKGDVIVKLSNTQLVLAISDFEANVSRISNEVRQSRLLMEQQTLEAKSQLLQYRYQLLQQQRDYERNKVLYAEKHLSEEEYKLSEEQYELTKERLNLLQQNLKQDSVFRSVQISSLEHSLARMQDNLNIVQTRLESLNFKAPVDGELASLNLEEGQVINVGQRIGQINILDSYKLRVMVDEYYISRVIRGLFGECDFSGTIYKAVTTKIYPEVRAGQFAVDMEFTDKVPENIRIGQTSRIKLELGESRKAILIPRGGFFQSTGGQWVYVVDESGKFAYKRNIRIGQMNPRYYEVLEGLEPGEKVIVSSYDTFGDADKLIFK